MRVSVESIPRATWRRVARHLESVRESLGGDADDARLGDEVCPIHRPDLECVAYWEFEVHGLKTTAARQHRGTSSGTGFVLASAGRHDVPIPHWSLAMEPPSRALEARAQGKPIHRMLKLDALTYAAEAHDGGLITHLGQMPLRLEDVRAEHRTEIAASSTVRITESDDDRVLPERRRKHRESPSPRLVAWTSWKALRSGYAREYRSLLSALAERAAAAWEIEDLVAEHGEGIHEGESLTIPLLRPGKIAVGGKGSCAVDARQRECGSPAVTLRIGDVPAGSAELPFEVVVRYEHLEPETLEFFVVPKDAPSNRRTTLPHYATHRGGRP